VDREQAAKDRQAPQHLALGGMQERKRSVERRVGRGWSRPCDVREQVGPVERGSDTGGRELDRERNTGEAPRNLRDVLALALVRREARHPRTDALDEDV